MGEKNGPKAKLHGSISCAFHFAVLYYTLDFLRIPRASLI